MHLTAYGICPVLHPHARLCTHALAILLHAAADGPSALAGCPSIHNRCLLNLCPSWRDCALFLPSHADTPCLARGLWLRRAPAAPPAGTQPPRFRGWMGAGRVERRRASHAQLDGLWSLPA